MKSLLVDVLREAQNNAGTGTTKPAAESRPGSLFDDRSQGLKLPDELRILETDAGDELDGQAADNDAMLLPILDERSIRDGAAAEAGTLRLTGRLPAAGTNYRCATGWIALLGRWSPALCVVAIMLAAGAYIAFQQLTAGQLNADLSNVSQQVSQSADRQDLPRAADEVAGRFPFINDRNPAVRDGSDADNATKTPAPAGDGTTRARSAAALPETNAVAAAGPSRDDEVYRAELEIVPTALVDLLSPANSEGPSQKAGRIRLLLQRHPQLADLHYALGVQLALAGRWPEANKAFADALNLDPANAAIRYNLAVSLEHLGRFEEARLNYEAALSGSNSDPALDRQMISRQLDRLATRLSDTG